MSEAVATPEDVTPAAAPETPAVELNATEQAALERGRVGLEDTNGAPKAPAAPTRPDNVPEKFWKDGQVDVEAMTASYAALEAKLSGAPVEETPAADEAVPEGVTDANGKIVKPAEQAAEETPAENPLTSLMDAARSDFTENRAFSEETSKALAEAGIPIEVQEVYQAGLAALGEKLTATVHGYTGGEENYNKMAAWAGRTLDDAELEAFNSAIDNPALAQNAVTGLYARFQAASKGEGKQVAPVNGAPSAGDVFTSKEEFKQAIADPRYASDVTYRKGVEDKLKRSRGFSVQ